MEPVAALTKRGDDAARELRPGSGLDGFDADAALLHVLFSRLEGQNEQQQQQNSARRSTGGGTPVSGSRHAKKEQVLHNLIGGDSPFFAASPAAAPAASDAEQRQLFGEDDDDNNNQTPGNALLKLAMARGDASAATTSATLGAAPPVASAPSSAAASASYPLDIRRQVAQMRSEYEIGRSTLHRMIKSVRDLLNKHESAVRRNHELEKDLQSLQKSHDTVATELRAVKLATEYLGPDSSHSKAMESAGEFEDAWRLEAEGMAAEVGEEVKGTVENFRTLVVLHRHSRGIANIVCPDDVAKSVAAAKKPDWGTNNSNNNEETLSSDPKQQQRQQLLDRHPALRRQTRRELVDAIRAIDERNENEAKLVYRAAQPPSRTKRMSDILRSVDEFLTSWSGTQQEFGGGGGGASSQRGGDQDGGAAADPLRQFAIATVRSDAHAMQMDNMQDRVEGITILRRTKASSSGSGGGVDEKKKKKHQQQHSPSSSSAFRDEIEKSQNQQQQQLPGRTLVKCRPQDRRVISLATMLVDALCQNRSPFLVVRSVVPDETVLSRATMRSHGLGPVWQTGGLASFCVSACPTPTPLLNQYNKLVRLHGGANNAPAASQVMHDTALAPGILSFLSGFLVPPEATVRFQTASAKAEAARRHLVRENLIRCYASSALPGTLTTALAEPYVDPTRPFFVTANESGGEYAEIFLTRAVVAPTGYGFASCHVSSAASFPRSWRLEGSSDAGVNWTLLRRHTDDRTLHHGCPRAVWAIPPQAPGAVFSRFRISIEGPNSSGTWHLNASSIEIYGRVLTLHSAVAPMLAQPLVPFMNNVLPPTPEELYQQMGAAEKAAAAADKAASCQFKTPYAGLGGPPAAFVPKKETDGKKKKKNQSPGRRKY